MLPAGDQALVARSYRRALAKMDEKVAPPVTSTVPSASKVAVCSRRVSPMLPAGDHLPVDVSYRSALAIGELEEPMPPVTSTVPPGTKVAVCWSRALSMLAAGDQVSACALPAA